MAVPEGWGRSLDDLYQRIVEALNQEDIRMHLNVNCGGFLSEKDRLSLFDLDDERRLAAVRQLVDLLQDKGRKAFEELCSLLKEHGHSDLAQELTLRRLSYESGTMQKSSKLADAEVVVPLCAEDLVDYIGRIAPKWNKLALKLGLHPSEVQSLQHGQDSQNNKCLQVLQLAIEQDRLTSWSQLLEVLRSNALKMPQLAEVIENNISAKGTGLSSSQDGECQLTPVLEQKSIVDQNSGAICESLKHDLKTVPFLMEDVVDYIDSIAPKWNMLGMKLGLQNEIQALQHSPGLLCDKCIQIFLLAFEQGKLTSWSQLLDVLGSGALKMTQLAEEIEKDMLTKYTGASPSSEVASSVFMAERPNSECERNTESESEKLSMSGTEQHSGTVLRANTSKSEGYSDKDETKRKLTRQAVSDGGKQNDKTLKSSTVKRNASFPSQKTRPIIKGSRNSSQDSYTRCFSLSLLTAGCSPIHSRKQSPVRSPPPVFMDRHDSPEHQNYFRGGHNRARSETDTYVPQIPQTPSPDVLSKTDPPHRYFIRHTRGKSDTYTNSPILGCRSPMMKKKAKKCFTIPERLKIAVAEKIIQSQWERYADIFKLPDSVKDEIVECHDRSTRRSYEVVVAFEEIVHREFPRKPFETALREVFRSCQIEHESIFQDVHTSPLPNLSGIPLSENWLQSKPNSDILHHVAKIPSVGGIIYKLGPLLGLSREAMRNRFSECHNTLDPTIRCAMRVLQDWTHLCAFTGENTLATLLQALLYLRVDDAVREILHYTGADLEDTPVEIQHFYSTL